VLPEEDEGEVEELEEDELRRLWELLIESVHFSSRIDGDRYRLDKLSSRLTGSRK